MDFFLSVVDFFLCVMVYTVQFWLKSIKKCDRESVRRRIHIIHTGTLLWRHRTQHVSQSWILISHTGAIPWYTFNASGARKFKPGAFRLQNYWIS